MLKLETRFGGSRYSRRRAADAALFTSLPGTMRLTRGMGPILSPRRRARAMPLVAALPLRLGFGMNLSCEPMILIAKLLILKNYE